MTDTLGRLAATFAMLSLVSIGGANATLPEIHRQVVTLLGWMDDRTFAHLFAISQIAPGPNVLLVSLIGWQMAGAAGLAVATLAILVPSSLLAFAAGRIIARWETTSWLRVTKAGLVPVTVGLILASGIVTARANDTTATLWIVTGVAAVAFFYSRRNPFWLLAGGALAGVISALATG